THRQHRAPPPMTLTGHNLAAGLTQAQLAERGEVSREWLIGIEQGRRPRAELGKLLGLLRVLGLDLVLESPSDVSELDAGERSSSVGASAITTNEITRRAMRDQARATSSALASILKMQSAITGQADFGSALSNVANLKNLMPRPDPNLLLKLDLPNRSDNSDTTDTGSGAE
ncbi:MAG: helix-turn-helix domain-containing protein, partial [Gulosibacter sp.]|uniref:helix-turn-helix domain-containing protein n=1 Tax=Gulosibacter sp. TaxID=2817531 RepID=UPI003F8EDA95